MSNLESKPLGYRWLVEAFGLNVMPHWKECRALEKGSRRTVERERKVIEYLPASQDPGDDVFAQLEFALRKEGVHLGLLRKLLPRLDPSAFTDYIASKPTGKYTRILWFLVETFTGRELELADVKRGNYVDLLDPDDYVTGPARKARRQRVNVNLLGTPDFSPMVRGKGLGAWNESDLREKCEQIVGNYPPEIFQRAVRYLYAKESKSSHEIERETPDQKRAETFINLLEQAWRRNFLSKEGLLELHRSVVNPRYADPGWRSEREDQDRQVYVGETLSPGNQRVHYAAPKPEDLEALMDEFLRMANTLLPQKFTTRIPNEMAEDGADPEAVLTLPPENPIPTLIAAAVISFTFDFLHPFSDGNGRIHRFLLHHVLAWNGFGPQGMILPISAVILNRPREYDQALESFSKPLMERVEYAMDDRQRMTVTNDTADFYRYIDCTELTRITIDFIRETIETELPEELSYLTRHDAVRRRIREVVELPDRIADLFVKLCIQNDGSLSKSKRRLSEFAPLTDDEIATMEEIVRTELQIGEV